MKENKGSIVETAINYMNNNKENNERIINAFSTMNLSILVDLLDEDKDYEDVNKWRFIDMIKNKLEYLKSCGDTFLKKIPSKCMGCNYGKETITFQGNISKRKLSLMFEIEGGTIIDIYECGICISIKDLNQHNEDMKKDIIAQ